MNVLVVDSDKSFCKSMKRVLSKIDSVNNINCFYSIEKISNLVMEDVINYDISFVDLKTAGEKFDNINQIFPKSKIIAFSESSKEISKYINKSYVDRFFKKPVDIVSVLGYLKGRFGIKDINCDLNKEAIIDELTDIGFSICHQGTLYLADAIYMMMECPSKKAVDLYEKIGMEHNMTSNQVLWSINNALNKAVQADKTNKMSDYFCFTDGRRPSAKYIMKFFVNQYGSV